MSKITLKIEGMSCGMCVDNVTRAMSAVKGVSDVKVDLKKGTATVICEDDVTNEDLIKAVIDVGFAAKVKHGLF